MKRQAPLARQLLHSLQHQTRQAWPCRGCGELVDGAFSQCGHCGTDTPL